MIGFSMIRSATGVAPCLVGLAVVPDGWYSWVQTFAACHARIGRISLMRWNNTVRWPEVSDGNARITLGSRILLAPLTSETPAASARGCDSGTGPAASWFRRRTYPRSDSMDVKTSYPISSSRGRSASAGSSSRITGSPCPGCNPSGQHASATASTSPVAGIRNFAVHRRVSTPQLNQLRHERHHLIPTGIEVLICLIDHDHLSFKQLPVPRPPTRTQLIQEAVGRLSQQLPTSREEIGITLDTPQRRILRDPLRSERHQDASPRPRRSNLPACACRWPGWRPGSGSRSWRPR